MAATNISVTGTAKVSIEATMAVIVGGIELREPVTSKDNADDVSMTLEQKGNKAASKLLRALKLIKSGEELKMVSVDMSPMYEAENVIGNSNGRYGHGQLQRVDVKEPRLIGYEWSYFVSIKVPMGLVGETIKIMRATDVNVIRSVARCAREQEEKGAYLRALALASKDGKQKAAAVLAALNLKEDAIQNISIENSSRYNRSYGVAAAMPRASAMAHRSSSAEAMQTVLEVEGGELSVDASISMNIAFRSS